MKRLTGVDLARGLGLIGVFVSHLTPEILSVFHGRSMALLLLVSGISVSLIRKSAQTKTLTRASVFLVIGFTLMLLRAPVVVILPYLAITIIAGTAFLNRSPKALFAFSLGFMLVLPLFSWTLRHTFKIHVGAEEDIPDILDLIFSGYYPLCALLPTFLMGLAVGKTGLTKQILLKGVLPLALLLVILGYGGSYLLLQSSTVQAKLDHAFRNSTTRMEETINSNAKTMDQFVNLQDGVLPPDHLVWQTMATPHSGTPFDIMGSTGAALLVLISCLLIAGHRGFIQRLISPIVALGTVSLSAYVIQILFSWALAPNKMPEPQIMNLTMFVGILLLLAWSWRRRFQRGPLEMLSHWLSERAAASPH